MIPEPVEIAAHGFYSFGVHPVEPPRTGRVGAHEPGAHENLQMLRDGRPRYGKSACDVAHRARSAREALKDLTAGRIAERLQRG